jgi:beta-glucosidase
MKHPYQDPNLSVSERVADLLSRMTLAEKIGQLNQVFAPLGKEDEIRPLVRAGKAGSQILATSMHAGADDGQNFAHEALRETQRVAVEESRLGIPLLFGRDVIHGHRTVFPIPLGQAASWDPDLVRKASRIAAIEAATDYVHWTFAPMLDICRDPRWGRIIEGCGEDPWLASRMAEAMVQGFQGEDLSQDGCILACAKHFAGYGAAEGGRDYTTVEISENTLRNMILPPFKAAVEAGVSTVMCAFHDLNGLPCSANPFLLRTVLREEWGFEGFVISDWASIEETVKHGTSTDFNDAAKNALVAGVDMEMVNNCYIGHLKTLVKEGAVPEELINQAAARILRAKFKLGLFERPYTEYRKGVHVSQPHRACARELAARSIVLLKNASSILPLAADPGKIALVGPLTDARREILGNWTLDGRPEETVSIADALRSEWPDVPVYAGGLSDTALRLCSKVDTVILVVGEDHMRNGENANVADIVLPPGQEELVEAVHALGKRIVLVICSGRPLVLTRVERYVDAILWAWHPGTEGGNAIVDVLRGRVNPSGKLPVTFPRATGQIPIYYNHKSSGRPVNDYYGSDSRYQDIQGAPMYRFGFGLSYTTFAYSDLRLSRNSIALGDTLEVEVLVKNIGNRAGEEIVQCYIRDLVASTTRPVKELKGFQRVHLEAGEDQIVRFTIGKRELSFYGLDGKERVEPGEFMVWVGGDSSADLGASFHVRAAG